MKADVIRKWGDEVGRDGPTTGVDVDDQWTMHMHYDNHRRQVVLTQAVLEVAAQLADLNAKFDRLTESEGGYLSVMAHRLSNDWE